MPSTPTTASEAEHPRSKSAPSLVVFSDLDGTLLRHEDYDWSPAREALAELARRRIPLVIASSKTRAEIEKWRANLGIQDPFISENGGALYVPRGATRRPPEAAERVGRYQCVRFGASYPQLRACLPLIGHDLGVALRGFGDMETPELERWTGLSGEMLSLAKAREHDEPFVPERPLHAEEDRRLEELADRHGLRLTRGGRFYHLTGRTSKGAAARRLLSAYSATGAPVRSLAVGDGPNDLELLLAADRAAVVARPGGTHAPELRAGAPRARFARGIGPAGFNEAVLEYLEGPW